MLREIIRYQIKPRVQHLILHVTDRCNLKCDHCFVDLGTHSIDLETIRGIADSVNPLLWIDITGGEPFLRDDLVEICAGFRSSLIGIPTNGVLHDRIMKQVPGILEKCPQQLIISVSIDGPPKTHNAIRGIDCYEKCIAALRLLRKLEHPRLSVKVNTTITNRNIDGLIPFMRTIRSLGLADFHSLNLVRGNPRSGEILLPPIAHLRAISHDLFAILESYDTKGSPLRKAYLKYYYRFMWRTAIETLEKRTQVIPCYGGKAHLVIYANGDVSSCELLPPIGNIYQQPLGRIFGSEEFQVQLGKIRDKECYCTHNCAMFDSIVLNPVNNLRLLKSALMRGHR